MPVMQTKNFGTISYESNSELEFPCGLPGFDSRRHFVALRFPESDPVVFLQSLEDSSLCFVTMPVRCVDSQYRLRVSEEDLGRLGLSPSRQPRIGEDVFCLSVLSIRESGLTANLLAPIVIDLKTRKAVQAIAPEGGYSHQYELLPEEAAVCS
jgi:flagellar assembly factor FliW